MPSPPGRKPAIFLQDFVDVELPLDRVRARVCGADGWLGPLAAAAADDGESLLLRLGPAGSTHLPGGELRVRVGDWAPRGEAVAVPIRWEAARLPALFPMLDGALELAPLGPDETRVLLQASYRPPFDGVGRWLDGAVLHRVAESTVRSFLRRLGEGLRTPGSAAQARPSAGDVPDRAGGDVTGPFAGDVPDRAAGDGTGPAAAVPGRPAADAPDPAG